MIIYPPHIGDTVPGFTSNGIITIPYTDNQAVDANEISKMSCRVRSLSNSTILATVQSKPKEKGNINEFEFSDISFTEGSYYKFQIAYVDKANQAGPYSSVAIGRCVGEESPTIGLKREEDGITFVGTYTYKLVTEPIYEYCFDFKNVDTNELIHTTGWKISETPGQKEFCEVLYQELKYSTIYKATFSIRTINNYTQSVSQTFMKQGELPILADIKVLAIQDKEAYENGYVKVALKGQAVTGYFELLRRAKDSNVWDKIADIDLLSESNLENFVWKDWSVEHGTTYTYAIRRRSNVASTKNVTSTKNESSPITVYFEDMFLSDGEKQLKIRFNPKVSSFKNTILEQKIDTIGGQYPFFFRNGSVKYKEIPISGLVSYYMDEANLFMSNEELGAYNFIDSKEIATASIYHGASAAALKTTDLVDYNIAAEKRFKLAVLDWLTNGEPKLFRSPTEGNYVVKLMNTSLSPNETLGRMLHNFSSTGYECGPHDYKSLKEQGIMLPEAVIKDPKPLPTVKTIMLYQAEETIIEGDFWNIVYETSSPTQGTIITVDGKDIVNITGRIVIPSAKKIEWKKSGNEYSTITYMYQPELIYNETDDIFKTIANGSTDVMSTLKSGEPISLSEDYHWIYSLILTPKQEWGYVKVVNYQKISEMTDWSKVEAYKKTANGEYELLTDEPADWGKKEASYYTKVEDQVWTLTNAGKLKVNIDGITIDLSDGNPRYYNDCTIDNIELGADVSGVIYGRKIKEPVREETK